MNELPNAYLAAGAGISFGLLVLAAYVAREALSGEWTRLRIQRRKRKRGGYIA